MTEPKGGASERPHVLIVSDDEDLASFLGEGLVIAGFWTSVVASAIQTLEVFRLRSFDVMLVDATLGGVGAFELVRRLRARTERAAEQRTDIPILFVAAAEREAPPEAVVEAGGDGLVLAPIELEELALRLFAVVSDWRAAHPGREWADRAAARSSDE